MLKPKSKGKAKVTAVIVCCITEDGMCWPVDFAPGDAQKVHGYVQHIQSGRIKFRREPALFVYDTPQMRHAVDEVMGEARKTRFQRAREFFLSLFSRHPSPVTRHSENA